MQLVIDLLECRLVPVFEPSRKPCQRFSHIAQALSSSAMLASASLSLGVAQSRKTIILCQQSYFKLWNEISLYL
jgi:hypothetical protein